MEEEDVDKPGVLMKFRKLCWAMLSMVRVPDLVGKGAGRGKAPQPGCARRLTGHYEKRVEKWQTRDYPSLLGVYDVFP